ncbi:MAG TPA: tetratricopeptide repeat protein, partial [Pirellulales bacterium]
MSIFSGSRRIAIFAAAIFAAFSLFIAPANRSFAQPASAPAASSKSETEMLIGPYVSGADSGQYKDITDAITRFKNGKIDEARELLSQAVKDSGGKLPPAETMLSRMILSVNQVAPGRAELERAVKAYPKDPEAYLMFAELAIQEGHITDADAILAKAQPLVTAYNDNPKRKKFLDSHLYADMANVDVARMDWDAAVEHAKQWLKTDPDSVQGHQLLARALFKQGLDRD